MTRPAHPGVPRQARPILLVEDSLMDVDLMLQGFEEHGVDNPVVVCRDGEEALRYVEAHSEAGGPHLPVLVLLDLRLPKVDGLEVLRQLRSRERWREVPIVILTTSREEVDRSAARALGATSYLVKPMDFEAFLGVVQEIKARWLLVGSSPAPGPEHDRGAGG